MKRFFLLLAVFLLVGIGTATAALDNAIGYYAMDTGSGSINVDSAGTINGTVVGATWLSSANAKLGNSALSYDGVNDYATSGDLAMDGDSTFTVAGWFKIDGTTSTEIPLSGEGSTTERYPDLLFSSDTSIQCGTNNLDARATSGPGYYSAGVWYHVVCISDGTTKQLWINGVSIDNLTTANAGDFSNNGIRIGARGDGSLWFGGDSDEIAVYDRVLNSSEISDLYNSGTGFNPYSTTPIISNFSITAQDTYTSSSLSNFSALIDGTTYTTTNGTITTDILDNSTSLYTITVSSNESGGYFNRRYTDYNVSSNLQADLTQSYIDIISFYIREKISNNTFPTRADWYNISTTSNGGSASPGYFPGASPIILDDRRRINVTAANNYTVDVIPENYFTNSYTGLDTNPQSTTSTNEYLYLYNHIANFTLSVAGSATDQNFSINLTSLDHDWNENYSTTNGYIEAELIHGNYSLSLTSQTHTEETFNFTLSNSTNLTNIQINASTARTVNVSFIDEQTNNLVTENITAYFTGSTESYERTTNNGTLYLELIEPQTYTVTYSAPSYEQREYTFTLGNREQVSLDLYLINSTEDDLILIKVQDTLLNPLSAYTVRTQRKNLSGTNYYTIETCNTDTSGQCIQRLLLYDVTYRFLIENNEQETVFTSSDQQITGTSITFNVPITNDALQGIENIYEITGDVSYSTVEQEFSFVWNDPNGLNTQGCLAITRIKRAVTESVSSSCSTSSSGTITYNQSINNSYTWNARGYVIVDSNEYTIDALSIVGEQEIGSVLGTQGLFIFGFLVVMIAAFLGLFNPVVPPITIVVLLFILNLLGILSLGATAITSIAVAGVMVAYLARS